MASKKAKLYDCPKCGAEPAILERGYYIKVTISGSNPARRLKPETYCVECACGYRSNFKSLDKKTAIETWERICKS